MEYIKDSSSEEWESVAWANKRQLSEATEFKFTRESWMSFGYPSRSYFRISEDSADFLFSSLEKKLSKEEFIRMCRIHSFDDVLEKMGI